MLIVSGVHANETSAIHMARAVYDRLRSTGADVGWFRIPRERTLLGLLDDPRNFSQSYAINEATRDIDVDLDGPITSVMRASSARTIFEFHNSTWRWDRFGIRSGWDVATFAIGPIGPNFTVPFQIAYWWNHEPGATYRRCLIEIPAIYRAVCATTIEHRIKVLRGLQKRGFKPIGAIDTYIRETVDMTTSAAGGLLCRRLIALIAHFIESAA
jgi:hypothetical protein